MISHRYLTELFELNALDKHCISHYLAKRSKALYEEASMGFKL